MRRLSLLLALLLLAPSTLAQRPVDRTGFSLGFRAYYADLTLTSPELEAEGTQSGIGGEVEIGVGITPSVVLFLNVGAADITQADSPYSEGIGAADLGVRLNVFPSQPFNPYVQGAVARQAYVATDGDVSLNLTGLSGTVGAGIQYVVTPGLSLDAGMDASVGTFDTISAEGESAEITPQLDTRTLRIGGGLVYVF